MKFFNIVLWLAIVFGHNPLSRALLCSDVFFETHELKSFKSKAYTKYREQVPAWSRFVTEEGARLVSPHFGKLPSHTPMGLAAVDSHYLNFELIEQGGRGEWVLVDLDDGGKVPVWGVFADLLRYLVAVDIIRGEIDFNLLSYYIQGLRGGGPPATPRLSEYIKDYLENKDSIYSEFVNSYIDSSAGPAPKFLIPGPKKLASIESIPRKKLNQFLHTDLAVIQWLGRKYGAEFEILDRALRIKTKGGSKGVPRFWYLVRLRGEIVVLEFKQMQRPGADFIFDQPRHHERITRLLNSPFWWEGSQGDFEPLEVESPEGTWSYLIRPRTPDIFNLKQEDLAKPGLLREVEAQQLYLMGLAHQKTLNQKSYYLNGFADNKMESLKKHIGQVLARWREHAL